MIDVGQIANLAFTAVSGAIGGVIKDAAVIKTGVGTYDAATGSRPKTPMELPCRALSADEKAGKDAFPEYTLGPKDHLYYLEGLTQAPKEVDKLKIGTQTFTIAAVADIVGANQFFAVIARSI